MRHALIAVLPLLACSPPRYPPPPVAQPAQPTTGQLSGAVRVLLDQAGARSAELKSVRDSLSSIDSIDTAPPTSTVEQKTLRSGSTRRAPVVAGELIVGTEQPLEPRAVLERLDVKRLGVVCAHSAYASQLLHLLRCTHFDATPLTEQETRTLANTIERGDGIRFIETNGIVSAGRTPNDPLYAKQWHYRTFGLPSAWDTTTGSANVVVAVIDTGIGTNADLTANLVAGIDLILDPARAGDGTARDDDPFDVTPATHWHGTHVAGTIAAAGNNALGVSGVAWGVRVLPVRVLGVGGGTAFDTAAGITWASGGAVPGSRVNMTPARVLNLSLGGDGPPSQTYQTAIDAAVGRGAVIVVAAGNEDEDTANKTPCNQTNVICVGATDLRGYATGYSNFGDEVTLSAPGGATDRDDDHNGEPDGVLSTLGDGTWGYMQGTSMASPHVAGLVGLMLSARPELSPAQVRTTLLAGSTTAIPNCASLCGRLLDAGRAIALLPTGRPVLTLSHDALFFTPGAPKAEVTLTNTGTSPLDIGLTVPTSEVPSLTWVKPAPLAGGASVKVAITMKPFSTSRTFTGNFTAGGDSFPVELRLRVPRPTPAAKVVALHKVDGKWVAAGVDMLDPDGNFSFHVPAGRYQLFAFSDDDGDGSFEEHEGMGVYPSPEQPAWLDVAAGAKLEHLEIIVTSGSAPPTSIGAACGSSVACQFGEFCGTWPGGYCTRTCRTSADCGSGSICVEFGNGALQCMRECSTAQPCRTDYSCEALTSGRTVCLP